jgi:hypothetical protein
MRAIFWHFGTRFSVCERKCYGWRISASYGWLGLFQAQLLKGRLGTAHLTLHYSRFVTTSQVERMVAKIRQ